MNDRFLEVQAVTIPDDGEWCLGCGCVTADYARVREVDGEVQGAWHAMWACQPCRTDPQVAFKLLRYLGAHAAQAREWGSDARWARAVASARRMS